MRKLPEGKTAIVTGGSKGIGKAIAPGVTETESAQAWRSGDMAGGSEIMEFAEKYVNLTVPDTKPLDPAYVALYLASDMGAAVTGLRVDNGGWL